MVGAGRSPEATGGTDVARPSCEGVAGGCRLGRHRAGCVQNAAVSPPLGGQWSVLRPLRQHRARRMRAVVTDSLRWRWRWMATIRFYLHRLIPHVPYIPSSSEVRTNIAVSFLDVPLSSKTNDVSPSLRCDELLPDCKSVNSSTITLLLLCVSRKSEESEWDKHIYTW